MVLASINLLMESAEAIVLVIIVGGAEVASTLLEGPLQCCFLGYLVGKEGNKKRRVSNRRV